MKSQIFLSIIFFLFMSVCIITDGTANELPAAGQKTVNLDDNSWMLTWCENKTVTPWELFSGNNDDIYISGWLYDDDADFDPDPNSVDLRSGSGMFLSRFRSSGEYVWTLTFPYPVTNIAPDANGNIYFTGITYGEEGSNPWPDGNGEVLQSGTFFLGCYNSSGDYPWLVHWGPEEPYEYDQFVLVSPDNDGNVYCAGNFAMRTDFDPGPGTEIYEPNLYGKDIFLSKFTSSGELIWVRTWGGEEPDWTFGDNVMAVDFDSDGNIYLTGTASREARDDDNVVIEGWTGDVYLHKIDPDGGTFWVRTWGGSSADISSMEISVSEEGNAYVSGMFRADTDFDPGPGEAIGTVSNIFNWQSYVSKFDTDGNFEWVNTWESSYSTSITLIESDSTGNLCIAGSFEGTVDLDPTHGTDEIESYGEGSDSVIISLTPNGEYVGNQVFITVGSGSIYGITFNSAGNLYAVGRHFFPYSYEPSDDIWDDFVTENFLVKFSSANQN